MRFLVDANLRHRSLKVFAPLASTLSMSPTTRTSERIGRTSAEELERIVGRHIAERDQMHVTGRHQASAQLSCERPHLGR